MNAEKSNVTELLRQRAEDLLAQASENFLPEDMESINTLHHELAVHQAELELQNEELRHTQLSLQKVRDRYVELYEHAPVGYVLLDAVGIIRHTNATWRAMLKWPDDDFRGIPFAETLVEDDARVFLSRFRSLFHNPADKQIELQIKRHQTKPFYAHITAKRSIGEGTKNDTNELMIIVSDISERKQAEIYRDIGREILQLLNEPNDLKESIQRVLTTLKTRTRVDAVGLRLQEKEDFPYFAQDGFSEDFLQTENTLLERNNDGGVCRDKDGNVCLECTCGLVLSGKTDASSPLFTKGGSFWSNDAVSLLDLPPDQDSRSRPRNNCIHQGYSSVALIPVQTRGRILGLIQLNDKRQDRFTLDTIEMLEDIAAHIGSALMRRRAEEAIKTAHRLLEVKNQEMEHFVFSVSHDLKSPLVTVKTFAGMLRQDVLDGDQLQINDDLSYIEKAADKMQQLLDALLQYSRIGIVDAPAQNQLVDQQVHNCLGSLAGILQQHQIQVSTGKLPHLLHGDPMHFGQIWQNLIENAAKYRGNQAQLHIEIGATHEGQDVVFYVRDNGMGIAPEHNERIFNLFSQLNPGSDGSGLGLALVKKIVSIYQGRIWVESEGEGRGSCFMFTLPAALITKKPTI